MTVGFKLSKFFNLDCISLSCAKASFLLSSRFCQVGVYEACTMIFMI